MFIRSLVRPKCPKYSIDYKKMKFLPKPTPWSAMMDCIRVTGAVSTSRNLAESVYNPWIREFVPTNRTWKSITEDLFMGSTSRSCRRSCKKIVDHENPWSFKHYRFLCPRSSKSGEWHIGFSLSLFVVVRCSSLYLFFFKSLPLLFHSVGWKVNKHS